MVLLDFWKGCFALGCSEQQLGWCALEAEFRLAGRPVVGGRSCCLGQEVVGGAGVGGFGAVVVGVVGRIFLGGASVVGKQRRLDLE